MTTTYTNTTYTKVESISGDFYAVTDSVRLGAEEGKSNDIFFHSAGQAFLYGGGGNDYMTSWSPEISYLFGQSGDDTLESGDGRGKMLDGGTGNDTLISRPRFDTLEPTGVTEPFGYTLNSQLDRMAHWGQAVISEQYKTGLDTLIGGKGQDRFAVGVQSDSTEGYALKAPRVRIMLNDGDGHDILTGGVTGSVFSIGGWSFPFNYLERWEQIKVSWNTFVPGFNPNITDWDDWGSPQIPYLWTNNDFATGLTEAQAENLEVNVNAENIAFTFKKLPRFNFSSDRFEVTLGYGTDVNTLRYVERVQGDITVDKINVNTGSSSFFFSGEQIRNIYQAFTQYHAQNLTVAMDTITAVRSNTDLLQIIQNNSTPVTSIA